MSIIVGDLNNIGDQPESGLKKHLGLKKRPLDQGKTNV